MFEMLLGTTEVLFADALGLRTSSTHAKRSPEDQQRHPTHRHDADFNNEDNSGEERFGPRDNEEIAQELLEYFKKVMSTVKIV